MPRANPVSRRAYDKARNTRIYRERKERGVCVVCEGKPKPNKNSPTGFGARCEACSAQGAAKTNARRRRMLPAWKALGICLTCGCREAVVGTQRCAYCAELAVEINRRNRHERARSAKTWAIVNGQGLRVGVVERVDYTSALLGAASVLGVRILPGNYDVREVIQ